MEPSCFNDGGDHVKDSDIVQRLSMLTYTLGELKKKLYWERRLLDQQKQEMKQKGWSFAGNTNYRAAGEFRTAVAPTVSTVTLNKEHLREIEKRCGEELEKLDQYLLNVNQFKSKWIKLRDGEEAKVRKNEYMDRKDYIENTLSEKTGHRGKIFFVDSDLY